MKHSAALLLLLASGCSTAPLADLLDFFWPGNYGRDTGPGYGGVCSPRPLIPPPTNAPGAPVPPAPVVAGPPVPAPPVPGPPVSLPPPPGPGGLAPPPPAPVGGF